MDGIVKEIEKIFKKPVCIDLKLRDILYIAQKIPTKAYHSEADGIVVCEPVGKDTISICREVFCDRFIFVFTQRNKCTKNIIFSELLKLINQSK